MIERKMRELLLSTMKSGDEVFLPRLCLFVALFFSKK